MAIKREDISEFMKLVDGATEETATCYLEMCGGNCKDAINLYYELHTQGGDVTYQNVSNTSNQYERETVDLTNSDVPDLDEDNVRAPDKHFSQALIHDMDEANFLYSNKGTKKKAPPIETAVDDSLGKLFTPPQNIICKLSFDLTRKKAKTEDKYILVNIQNSEFDSARLNRDIWKDETIQQILGDFFIFWLRHETDQDAMAFMHTYKVTTLPYICALCKRTGRQLKVWNLKQFEDVICAQSQLYEFIENAERKYATDSAGRTSDKGTSKLDNSLVHNIKEDSKNVRGLEDKKKENQLAKTGVKTKEKTGSKMDNKFTDNKKEEGKPSRKKEGKKTETAAKKEITSNEKKSSITTTITTSTTANVTKEATTPAVKLKDIALSGDNKEYNNINTELSELHRLRLERMKKK